MGDALIIFVCLFLPAAALNYLGTGRDVLLFQTRPRTSRLLLVLALLVGIAVLLWLGFSIPWAVALITACPAGAGFGTWAGGDGPLLLRFRLFGH